MLRRGLVIGMAVLLASCGGSGVGGTGRIAFNLQLVGLPALGPQGGTYEGWAVLGGIPISTGKFRIDDTTNPASVTNVLGTRVYGTVDGALFGPANTGLGGLFPFIVSATHFFVTIEPELDINFVPSDNVVMAGPIVNANADLTFTGDLDTGVPANPDLTAAAGNAAFFAATGPGIPTNGVWFTPVPMQPGGGLTLPVPFGNWTYEGWVEEIATGVRYSTGKFLDAGFPDLDAATSLTRGGANIGLDGPGEEFLEAATINDADVLNLVSGDWVALVTIEPCSDNSFLPSPLRILAEPIPTDAVNAMTGFSAMTVEMNPLNLALPQLTATATPGMLSFTGSAPGEIGGPRDGFYAVWSDDGVNPPDLVARFIVSVAAGTVTSLDGMTLFGSLAAFTFDPANTGLPFPAVENAVEIFITLQAQPGVSPGGPSPHAVLSGQMTAGQGALTVFGTQARGIADFSQVSGSFICSTPTDNAVGVAANDGMGIWFRTLTGLPALDLPALPVTWRYEGWVENTVTGERRSTGRFCPLASPDEDAMTWPGRGMVNTGFSVPGQDFVRADPGTTIPAGVDLGTGWMAVITLEPFPDTSLDPSAFVILNGPLSTMGGVSAPFTNRAGTFPTGTLTFDP